MAAVLALVVGVVITVSGALQRPTYSDDYIAEANERIAEEHALREAAEEEPLLVLPESPRVLMIGDSYMLGTGADGPDTTWARQVASNLGWDAEIDGVGGTGFTVAQAEGAAFADRLPDHAGQQFDLVFIEGGQNDHLATPEELTAAVNTTVARAQQQWPGASVIVMGPAAPQPLGDMLGRMADPIDLEAKSLGALGINPVASGWMTMENSPGFDFDGAHVNQAGHDHIATKVSDQIQFWLEPA